MNARAWAKSMVSVAPMGPADSGLFSIAVAGRAFPMDNLAADTAVYYADLIRCEMERAFQGAVHDGLAGDLPASLFPSSERLKQIRWGGHFAHTCAKKTQKERPTGKPISWINEHLGGVTPAPCQTCMIEDLLDSLAACTALLAKFANDEPVWADAYAAGKAAGVKAAVQAFAAHDRDDKPRSAPTQPSPLNNYSEMLRCIKQAMEDAA